jgi:hypothetical protein
MCDNRAESLGPYPVGSESPYSRGKADEREALHSSAFGAEMRTAGRYTCNRHVTSWSGA